MIPIPNWLKFLVQKNECPSCSDKMNTDCKFGYGVIGFGMSLDEASLERGKEKHCIKFEYKCPNCGNICVISLPIDKFTNNPSLFMDEMKRAFKTKKIDKIKVESSKISNKEVKDFIDKMNGFENYEQLLEYIGAIDKKYDKQ